MLNNICFVHIESGQCWWAYNTCTGHILTHPFSYMNVIWMKVEEVSTIAYYSIRYAMWCTIAILRDHCAMPCIIAAATMLTPCRFAVSRPFYWIRCVFCCYIPNISSHSNTKWNMKMGPSRQAQAISGSRKWICNGSVWHSHQFYTMRCAWKWLHFHRINSKAMFVYIHI